MKMSQLIPKGSWFESGGGDQILHRRALLYMNMINIEQALQDNEPKYYVAILRDNAATPLLAGVFATQLDGTLLEIPAIETPDGELVAYNIYRTDEYRKMHDDPAIPQGIKALVFQEILPNIHRGTALTSDDIEGWHVIRTPTPLSGDQLLEVLVTIQQTLDTFFYNKAQRQVIKLRDSVVMEEVYLSNI